MRFRLLPFVLAVGFAFQAPCGYAMAQGQISRTALGTKLRQMYPSEDGDVRYFRADIDLNDDGTKETVVYVIGPMVCGTGGCNTLVLAPGKAGPRLIANIFVTHPPIAVAATRTHGWRDLTVSAGEAVFEPTRFCCVSTATLTHAIQRCSQIPLREIM